MNILNLMLKILNKIKKIKNYFIFFFIFLNMNNLTAEIYNEIKVKGNDRLSIETIIMFSGLKTGLDVDKDDLNQSIKELYETNYFEDIKIIANKKILEIVVKENPIIQSIKINGVKNKSLLKNLYDTVKKYEKYPFLKNDVVNQKNFLLNAVRVNGFYFASINTSVLDNRNNSVDLVYNFDLGERAIIKKINFQGNKVFKDAKLRNVIKSEEGKFWKFLTSDKYLDEKKINNDEKLLKKFFLNKGFFNVKIKSSYAKNVDNQYFELNFNIDAGKKYYFNEATLNKNITVDDNIDEIKSIIKSLNGKRYSPKLLNSIVNEIDKISLLNEIVFTNTVYNLTIVEDNKINVQFIFEDLKKFYVDQINIFGNFITEEKVIRNSLIVDEGDAFNQLLFEKSIDNIKSRNIFKSVKHNIKESTSDNQKKIIDIVVEEDATGEIFAGAGAGTSGASVTAGITERNYLGKGIKLSTNLMISEDEIKGKFFVVNPNYKNTDRSINTILESTSSDFLSTGGFKTTRTGFGVGTGFEQYADLFINLDISAYYEKLETASTASAYKKKQEGDYIENLLSYNLTLNKLDQNYQPTDGYKFNFKQVLPIYSDDLSISNTFNASRYYSVTDNLIFSGKFFLKSVNSIDDDVRVSRRVYIPSSKLRGFEPGKIGPKDGNEYVGGNIGSALNLNTTLPNVLSGYENVDLSLFLDAASLWEVDYDSSLESSNIRSSTGLAVNWFTPVGPLTFSYAIPINSESTDKKETFRFKIGTSF